MTKKGIAIRNPAGDLSKRFQKTLESKRNSYISTLKSLCDIECGSEMLKGVSKAAGIIEGRLKKLGLSVHRHEAKGFGDHLVASTCVPGRQIVMGGHIDTTYTDYSGLPGFHIEGEYAVGPGTADMKGGIVVFLAALECLKEEGLLETLPLTVIFNTDEERGAVTSRPIFKEYAKSCLCALFSECGGKNNGVVVARRGKQSYMISVSGVGRHVSEDAKKASAIEELAHKIIAIESLNGEFPGDTFNVGKVWGGMASNTVPENAHALVDIQYTKAESGKPIMSRMRAICKKGNIPNTRTELNEISSRPPWERNGAALYRILREVSLELGQPIAAESRRGTADSNWFGAAGVPTIDGLGPVGFDDHTPRERIRLQSLFERALLVAMLLRRLDNKGGGLI